MHELAADTPAEEVTALIHHLNQDSNVDSFLVQLPLPEASRGATATIVNTITSAKDVDGLTAATRAALKGGDLIGLYPTPAYAVLMLLAVASGEVDWQRAFVHHLRTAELPQLIPANFRGKRVVVVSNGEVFGDVLALVFERHGLATTVRRSDASDLAAVVRTSDVVVPAVGLPGCVTGDMLKPGAVVLDVGTTRVGNALKGDLDWASARFSDVTATPVPGGVGPVTVACLFANAVALRFLST